MYGVAKCFNYYYCYCINACVIQEDQGVTLMNFNTEKKQKTKNKIKTFISPFFLPYFLRVQGQTSEYEWEDTMHSDVTSSDTSSCSTDSESSDRDDRSEDPFHVSHVHNVRAQYFIRFIFTTSINS